MYTKEQEEMALREYERLGSVTAVIQRLGYPSESTLYRWYERKKAGLENRHGQIAETTATMDHHCNTPGHPRHPSAEFKYEVLHRCFELGEDVEYVSKEIGYSRMSIYTWRRKYLKYGMVGLMAKRKSIQSIQGRSLIHCGVDRLQIRHERLYVLVGYIFAGIAELMDDAVLNLCLGEHCFNRCGKSGQIIRTGNENVLNAPVSQAVEYRCPEFGALIFTDPHTQNCQRRKTKYRKRRLENDPNARNAAPVFHAGNPYAGQLSAGNSAGGTSWTPALRRSRSR